MSKQEAYLKTIELAKEKLAGINLSARCEKLGLPKPDQNILHFRAFGNDMRLDGSFDIIETRNEKPVKLADQIFILHYLLCDVSFEPKAKLISFRDLPGGQFYWNPFLSRSVNPMLSRIGNNIDLLREKIKKFDYKIGADGDFSAIIHVIGKINIMLVYHLGDEEFPPAANILFDSSIKHVFNTEDVAWLAGRICLALL